MSAINEAGRPLWHRVVDFPLVSLLIALAVVTSCFAVSLLTATNLSLPKKPNLSNRSRPSLLSREDTGTVTLFCPRLSPNGRCSAKKGDCPHISFTAP